MRTEIKLRAIVLVYLSVVGVVTTQFNGNREEYFHRNPVSNKDSYWYRYWNNGDAPPRRGSTDDMSAPYQQSQRKYEWHEDFGKHWQAGNTQEKKDSFQLPEAGRTENIKNFLANLLNNNKNGGEQSALKNGPKNGDNQSNSFREMIRKGVKNFLNERNIYPFNGDNKNGDYAKWTHHQNTDYNNNNNNNQNDDSSVDYSYNNLPDTKTETPSRSPFHFWIGVPPPTSNTIIPDRNSNPNWFRPDARPTNNGHTGNGGNVPSVGSTMDTVVPIQRDLGQINLIIEAQQHCGRGTDSEEYTETSFRIARGDMASETYPWLVAINHLTPGKEMQFICGGSLISTKHAVSAAHCFLTRESDQYEFIISNNRILKPSEAEWTLRKADRIILHPGYNPEVAPANADVAVIVFKHPVQFGQFIKPICLWRGDSSIRGVVGEIGRVVGWGADENLAIADTLPMEINMGVIDYKTCILRDNTFINIVGENSFCTGYKNGSGPCMGDSGSGFMLKQNGRWSLRGVVSLTTKLVGCDINHYIGITDVAKYISWIENVLR